MGVPKNGWFIVENPNLKWIVSSEEKPFMETPTCEFGGWNDVGQAQAHKIGPKPVSVDQQNLSPSIYLSFYIVYIYNP